jgi:poly-beta-1,6-N-acetyl-D-glucosamine synthase
MRHRSYVVISPCRDEAAYAERTIASVVRQRERPHRWVIVDDGSTDGTSSILHAAAMEHPWISVVTRHHRPQRALGGGVVEAFNAGLEHIELDTYDYISKLDLDVDLPTGYFSGLMDLMESDPRLATVSGKPFFREAGDGGRVAERCGDENSVGMTKFYRVEAFKAIGGLVPQLMWDAIDCHTARVLGWRALAATGPALQFEHLRPMGSSDRGILRGRRRHGHGQWLMGTDPLFMLASAVLRLGDTPKILGSVHIVVGYASAACRRVPRHIDEELRRQLRLFQRQSLLWGKRRAIRHWEARQQNRWHPSPPASRVTES